MVKNGLFVMILLWWWLIWYFDVTEELFRLIFNLLDDWQQYKRQRRRKNNVFDFLLLSHVHNRWAYGECINWQKHRVKLSERDARKTPGFIIAFFKYLPKQNLNENKNHQKKLLIEDSAQVNNMVVFVHDHWVVNDKRKSNHKVENFVYHWLRYF